VICPDIKDGTSRLLKAWEAPKKVDWCMSYLFVVSFEPV